jgi:hypothetical protein
MGRRLGVFWQTGRLKRVFSTRSEAFCRRVFGCSSGRFSNIPFFVVCLDAGVALFGKRNLFVFVYPTGAAGNIPMTTVTSNPPVARVPARAAKKVSATKKDSHKSIFGLLSDWKIDTQAFLDEMRN